MPSILIVEPNPQGLAVLDGLLEDEGYHRCNAMSLAEARQQLSKQPFDVVMLNVQSQSSEALQFAREVHSKNVPIIGFGATAIPYESQALATGCKLFIEKPFTSEVLDAVQRLLQPRAA